MSGLGLDCLMGIIIVLGFLAVCFWADVLIAIPTEDDRQD